MPYHTTGRAIPRISVYVLPGTCFTATILRDQQPWWRYARGDLTGALHDLQLQLSPLTTSIILCFNKHAANPGSPGKWPLKWTERGQEQM